MKKDGKRKRDIPFGLILVWFSSESIKKKLEETCK